MTPEYRAYLDAQIAKTQQYAHLEHLRVVRLLAILSSKLRTRGRMLCVGCRNRFELDHAFVMGFEPTGIDLVSIDDTIHEMDMHALAFPDRAFDVVFGCHVLEHAYDLPRVLAEWQRVTKPGGIWVVEMPIGFTPTAVDRLDIGNLSRLRALVGPYVAQELYAAEIPRAVHLIGRLHG